MASRLKSFGLIIVLVLFSSNAWGQSEPGLVLPPPSSVEEVVTPLEFSFVPTPERPRVTDWLKGQLKEAPPFFRDSKLNLHIRSAYFFEEQFDDSKKEAWAAGGWLEYKSGWLCNHFGVAATLYTSQPLYAPDDRDGTNLLEPGQNGFTVLGEAYGRIKIVGENEFRFFRQTYENPYINKNDGRMVPNTFEGYTLRGIIGDEKSTGALKYVAGYVSKIKERNQDRFVWMSEDAGADVQRGTIMGGALYTRGPWSIGAIEYYTEDTLNIFYAEAKRRWKLSENWGLALSAQFSDQQSVGDNALSGGSPFHTAQGGIALDVSYRNAVLTAAFTSTDSNRDMVSPWSSYPGFTSCQVLDFNRAGEDALMFKLSYDFKRFVEGLSMYALYTVSSGRKNSSNGIDLPDENEFDADVQYRFQTKCLKGLSLRARYGTVHESGGGRIHQVRGFLNYDLPLL
ncbi:MAG: OprD family porin [Syntrophobacteraceae bacterium]|nr:OprD family porin [Syntrophobacteraceae bacterium]